MDIHTPSPTLPREMRWQAPRHPVHERGKTWYLIGGGLVVLVTIYGLLSGAWSLALVSILCGALYFLIRDHKFEDSTCTLSTQGVQIDDRFIPWTAIRGFWFVQTPSYVEIRFALNVPRMADATIQTGNRTPAEIRVFLNGLTKELIDQKEGLFDILSRFAKL